MRLIAALTARDSIRACLIGVGLPARCASNPPRTPS